MIIIMIISNDILDTINNYLNIKSLILFLNTNKYYYSSNKKFLIENIINKYFKKNIVYNNDIYYYYDILKKSDFNISLLEYIKNINYKLYDINKLTNDAIISTFTTFKLAKMICISNNIINTNISDQLIEYFDEVYNLKYSINCFTINRESINKFKEILYLNKYVWCCININLYNIYEIWKHIKYNNKKLFYYNYNNNIIINNNENCIYKTLLFLLELSIYFNDKRMKFYIIYHTFQYINDNILFINNIENLKKIIIDKIYEIKTEITVKYYTIMPQKFIKNLFNLFNDVYEKMI